MADQPVAGNDGLVAEAKRFEVKQVNWVKAKWKSLLASHAVAVLSGWVASHFVHL